MAKLPMPQYAKRQTILMRYIKEAHEKIAFRLGRDSLDTLRACAWQIEIYLEEHGEYYDAEFLRTLQHTMEKIVQHKCNTTWSVAKAKRDLRGRTRGVNQFTADKTPPRKRVYVPKNLSQAIDSKLTDPNRETE